MLKLFLLGPPRLTWRDQDWPWRAPPKTLPLLARLALAGPGPHERAALARTLWPDAVSGEARANLRRHLQYLRAALPAGGWLSASATHVRLSEAQVWVDVSEFETRSAHPETMPQAAELYRGPLLDGVEDEEWVDMERERLRAHYLVLLGALIQERRAALDHTRAIYYAERLLAEDPLREDMLRQLVTMHAEAGNRTSALARLERFAAQLSAEMGLPPMPETLALRERLLGGEALDPFPLAAAVAPDQRAGPWQLPLAGREAPLRQLHDAWARASRGRGQTLWLSGEAGVGKTRLARELALSAEAEGTLVLVGRTTSPEVRPHQALADALGAALPLLPELPGVAGWGPPLATLLPALHVRLPGLPGVPALPAEQELERLAASVAEALGALARRRPLLLGLEDLHWASAASLNLLAFLARRAPPRTLILATSRDEVSVGHPLREVRRRLQEEGALDLLALGRLRPDDALAVANTSLEPATAAVIAGRSEGLPLYLTELVFEALQAGPAHLPRSIQEMVRARLERLTPAPRSVVEIASVLGPAFTALTLQDLCGWPEGELLAALDDLLSARFLRETFGGHLGFVHGLVQESVYAELDSAAGRRLHRRAGRALAQQARPGQAADIARHLDLGGLGEQAAPHYAQAARQAARQGAPDDAEQFLKRALELAVNPSLRFETLLLREEISQRRGELPAWARDLDALADLAASWGDLEARREAVHRRIALARRIGDYGREFELIQELRTLAGDTLLWQARAALGLGRWHYVRGETAAAARALRPARDAFLSPGQAQERLTLLHLDALIEIKRGHLDAAETLLGAALAHAETSQDALQRLMANDIGLMLTQANDDLLRQHGYALRHRDLAREVFNLNAEATAEAFLGGCAIYQAQFSEARGHYTRAGELWKHLGRTQGLIAVRFNLASVDILTGAVVQGLAELTAANALALETGDHMYQADCFVTAALGHWMLGQFDQARTLAQRGADHTHQDSEARLHAEALTWLGAAEHGLGQHVQAITTLGQAAALLRTGTRPSNLALALCFLIAAQLALPDLATASQTAGELRTLKLERIWPLFHDLYHWTLGQVTLAQGHPTQAAEHFAQAHAALLRRVEAVPEPERREAYLALPLSRSVLGSAGMAVAVKQD